MKKWSLFLSVCISMTLAAAGPASGEVLIPPIPISNGGTNSNSQTNTNTQTGPGPENNNQNSNQSSNPSNGNSQNTSSLSEPVIQAEGAVVMDAATGTVLYGKNANNRYYPASITKLMTALLTLEHTNMTDMVTFSAQATTNLESGSVSLGIAAGDKLSVQDSLYGLLLKSANEIGNGLAEHLAGSVSNFAEMMNARAKALGCTNTNFTNPHGLNDSNHYTTPYDMALIAREAFKNPTLCKIASTTSYQFPATKLAGARTITMGHKMLYTTDSRYYPGIIGGKTGYTSLAGNTLVTCVEQDGVRLIAVVMKSKSTHYTDTKALLDYGFAKMKSGAGTQSPSNQPSGGPSFSQTAAGWNQDSTGWYYIKEDGSRASNQWLTLGGADYWFDSNAYMATGWRQFANGAWYYFKSSGAMETNKWRQDGDGWFYLGGDGVMMTNTTTPDGFRVDQSGRWIQGA